MDIFLLLGSNQNDPLRQLKLAQTEINLIAEGEKGVSSIYRTAPWGITNQPEFYNQVLIIDSSLGPSALLAKLQAIEKKLGRIREEKWGPRIIDIDVLFYSDKIIETESLQIPHPGIPDRRFTLEPLNEIAPDFLHPVLKKKISTLLTECNDQSYVEKLVE